jgi:putative FmdB family regulatory protein
MGQSSTRGRFANPDRRATIQLGGRASVPLYEYHCSRCGRFEVIRRFSDSPLAHCPTCDGAVDKLISAPAIQFKGSGWYVTDYARKPAAGNTDAKAETPATSGTPTKNTPNDSSASGSSPTK